ncbi:hypothetical protein [Nissabacter sp. SGAir0207]|uniref:hypothetical protein n=1 Tax=Nissabacter sp. SGAir0207 TaxID=2126321 RepID=UPI0010CD3DD6|nr:hypothetical protein [Nissabacter sp. SGAir0207]QCR38779.1 hypothetical protein C1N62_21880 [Nissabacter sp. SGAir0207]
MNKQDIKAMLLAHGLKPTQQPDGSMDLHPYLYRFVEALLERFWLDVANPVSVIQIKPCDDAPAHSATLFRGLQVDPDIPVFVMKRVH